MIEEGDDIYLHDTAIEVQIGREREEREKEERGKEEGKDGKHS